MEDALVLRSSRVIQKKSPMAIATVEDDLSSSAFVTEWNEGVTLNEEDVAKLQKIFCRVEELEKHISFNSCWRQEAEADYLTTRNRLLESESVCSSAVALANEAGQISTSMGSRLAWFEIDLKSKGNIIGDHAAQLNALILSSNSIQQTLHGLTEQTAQLEAANTVDELAILQHQYTELERKVSKGKTRHLNFEKEYAANCKNEQDRMKVLEERLLKAETNTKNADILITHLQTEVNRLKEKETEYNGVIKRLQDELAEEKIIRIDYMRDDISISSKGVDDEKEKPGPSFAAPTKWTDIVQGSTYDRTKEDICKAQSIKERISKVAQSEPGVGGVRTMTQRPETDDGKTSPPENAPKGPKKWVERQLRQKGRRNYCTDSIQDMSSENQNLGYQCDGRQRLRTLEKDIRDLKRKIKEKEANNLKSNQQRRRGSFKKADRDHDAEWEKVKKKHRRSPAPTTLGSRVGTWSKRMIGRYKLVIHSADDGSEDHLADIQDMAEKDRANKTLFSQIATIGNFAFEYKNRNILHHNHRGGLLFSVETPQEMARCINLGIWINGRKHRVQAFEKAQPDDICSHCSAWGHLERSCRYGLNGRCGICGKDHRTDAHNVANIKKGKQICRCPNCGGDHTAFDENCSVRIGAMKKNKSKIVADQTTKNQHRIGNRNRGAKNTYGRSRRHV